MEIVEHEVVTTVIEPHVLLSKEEAQLFVEFLCYGPRWDDEIWKHMQIDPRALYDQLLTVVNRWPYSAGSDFSAAMTRKWRT